MEIDWQFNKLITILAGTVDTLTDAPGVPSDTVWNILFNRLDPICKAQKTIKDKKHSTYMVTYYHVLQRKQFIKLKTPE